MSKSQGQVCSNFSGSTLMSVIQIKAKSKDVFELPDGSIAYTMKRALLEYKRIKPVKYTISDLILFLLYSQDKSVRGRTLLIKEIFLMEQEIFKNQNAQDCRFIPYYYGPYSFHVVNKLHNLIIAGLISVKPVKGRKLTEYVLTKKGERMIRSKYKSLPPKIRDALENLRMALDQYGSSKILNAIYLDQKYQQYVIKSKIGNRYKLITWGKGKK